MKMIKGILPGIFTMGNLACGFGSIIIAANSRYLIGMERMQHLNEAVWLIILAAFFDFLDGLVARFSKTTSKFGVELDSLADIISFGVAPAVLIINFSLISKGNWAWILAFVYLMAGTFRLARFNLDATFEGKVNFVGLPIPSAAVAIVSYTLFSSEMWGSIRFEKFFIILLMATAVLMVSTVEFETMPKFNFNRRANRIKMTFLILSAAGVMINASLVIFPLALMYISYGLIKMMIMMFAGNGKVRLGNKGGTSGREKREASKEG